MFVCYINGRRCEYPVKDGLTPSERRMEMLRYIRYRKEATYKELSEEFSVSLSTVWRDIVFLSDYSQIYTRQGSKGGVVFSESYNMTKNCLSDEEESCLYKLSEKVSDKEKEIIIAIIKKFSRSFI